MEILVAACRIYHILKKMNSRIFSYDMAKKYALKFQFSHPRQSLLIWSQKEGNCIAGSLGKSENIPAS